jgi:hypothetical protein
VLALRLLLLRERSPATDSALRRLESLLPQWHATPGWLEGQAATVALLRDTLRLRHLPEEDILEVLAVCSTNAFCKYLEPCKAGQAGPGSTVGTNVRLVFLLAAMMSHSCTPNAEQAIHGLEDGLRLQLRTTRPIPAGEQIQISYTELLAPTAVRQFELLNSKLFLCGCRRCEDPEELGSGAGGVRCRSCLRAATPGQPPGLLLPAGPDLWRCDLCRAELPATTVLNLVFKIYEQLELVLTDPSTGPEALEAFLAKFSQVLGPCHGILQRARYSLCGQYGRLPGYQLAELGPARLARKLELCSDMLAALDLLQPGRSSRRGLILYELHIALLVSGSELERSLACLREARDILRDEPRAGFGGQLDLGGAASLPGVEAFVRGQGRGAGPG